MICTQMHWLGKEGPQAARPPEAAFQKHAVAARQLTSYHVPVHVIPLLLHLNQYVDHTAPLAAVSVS